MKAVRNFIDYALFIAFFPHLIAGPIIRARRFIPQIWSCRTPATIVVQSGIILVLSGLIKKMVFADPFAVVSDSYFNDPMAQPGWLAAWSGCIAFFMQVFFDFSGYTDIARGCAKLLGFEFPLNFARPFLARNPPDFWQRWHITLSTWVRGLSVHAIQPRKKRPVRIVPQPHDCNDTRGTVAWSQLDICRLGSVLRGFADRVSAF